MYLLHAMCHAQQFSRSEDIPANLQISVKGQYQLAIAARFYAKTKLKHRYSTVENKSGSKSQWGRGGGGGGGGQGDILA